MRERTNARIPELDLSPWYGREIECACGRRHFCPIREIVVGRGALERLPELTEGFGHILLAADENTWRAAGEEVSSLLGSRAERTLIFRREGRLVPDEEAVKELEAAAADETDLILGIGSGVINDLCKYVSWKRGLAYGIAATAPSMDGYASSGAAMIAGGMKVTYTARPPRFILADTDIVRQAPPDMLRAGYGDIIGKYSSLCDWKLSRLMRGEYFCQTICDLVLTVTDSVRGLAERIVERDPDAVEYLTKALILIGITLSLAGSTRPGSGSEHHLSHFFEIVSLLRGEPHFCHGIDVGYATVVTAGLRERIAAAEKPEFHPESEAERLGAWERIYGGIAEEVKALQTEAGSYRRDMAPLYREKWTEIRAILSECPSAAECRDMLERAGYAPDGDRKLYGASKLRDAVFYGKDLKDRYSVLWLYYDLFSGLKRPGVEEG